MIFFFSKNDGKDDNSNNKDKNSEAKVNNILQTKFDNVNNFIRSPKVFCEYSEKIENESENIKNTQSFNLNENISSVETVNKEDKKINEEQNFSDNDIKSNKSIKNDAPFVSSSNKMSDSSLEDKDIDVNINPNTNVNINPNTNTNISNNDVNSKIDKTAENSIVEKDNFTFNANNGNNFLKKSVLDEKGNNIYKSVCNVDESNNSNNNVKLKIMQLKTQSYRFRQNSDFLKKFEKKNKITSTQKYAVNKYNLQQKQHVLQNQNSEQIITNNLEKDNDRKNQNNEQKDKDSNYNDIKDIVLPKSMVLFNEKILSSKQDIKIKNKSDTQTNSVVQERNNNVESNSDLKVDSKLNNDNFYNINNVAASIENKANTFNVNNIFISDKKFKKEDSNNKDNYFYSSILEFTSALPVECFNKDYLKIDKRNYLEVSKNITDDDLLKLTKKYPYLESLDISNCDKISNFEVLNKFENLKELDVSNCDKFNNLDFIKNCTNLEILNVSNTDIKNINAVENFKNLRIFNCACNNILNVDALEHCENLIEVILWNCITLSDINGLSSLKKIRLLDLDYTSVVDLFPLSNCLNIEFLFMDNCIKLTDIYTISILKNLKCLLADGSNILMASQLESFSDLKNIEYLTLKYRKINTLQYFSKMTKMKELILEGCNINDLSSIENFEELVKLDLTGNSLLRDLNPICKLKNIKKLIVGGSGSAGKIGGKSAAGATSIMNIDNVSVIKNFTKLEELDLNTNPRLKDISAIRFCENMEEVSLQNCTQLEDVSVLGYLTKLTKINLTSNPRIKDLFFLKNLPDLEELQFNGTVVYTPSLAINLKKATGLKILKGNNADMIAQTTLVSGKKKSKLQKSLKKYFKESCE